MRLTDSATPLDRPKHSNWFWTLILILLLRLKSFWSTFSGNLKWIRGNILAPIFSTIDLNLEQVLTKESVRITAQKLRIWSHLLKKSLMENFIFCLVIFSVCSNDFLTKSRIISAILPGYLLKWFLCNSRRSCLCSPNALLLRSSSSSSSLVCFLLRLLFCNCRCSSLSVVS